MNINKKIRAAIIGYGNIGQYALEALNTTEDFEVAGIVRRNAKVDSKELEGHQIVSDISQLKDVDVAILCAPTRTIPETATAILEKGINTVDSFDIHSQIVDLKKKLAPVAKKNNCSAIIAAGWDPGSDSIVRTLMLAMAPKGLTYTNFGPGMSMGHSVAVKAIDGVKDALSVTVPLGTSIHRRLVYVELKEGVDFASIEAAIKKDAYFASDETHVKHVRSIDEVKDTGHGTHIIRKGVSSMTDNQIFEYTMKINNPALTAQFLVAAARASMKQASGAYTVIEVPPINFLFGDIDHLIHDLV